MSRRGGARSRIPARWLLSHQAGLPVVDTPLTFEDDAPFTVEELTAGIIEATGLDRETVTAWMGALYAPDSVAARAGELGAPSIPPATS